jgi:malonyl-CoA O-methyltransferase
MNAPQNPGTLQAGEPVIPRAAIARSFGDAAATYNAYAGLQRTVADKLLQRVPAGLPIRMLDLGCGTGYCAAKMHQQFPAAELVAIDLAMPMLGLAAGAVPAASLVCADAQDLPLTGSTFDLVVSSLAMQWCADPQPVLQELGRVLKPGGTVLISTFGPDSLDTLRQAYRQADSGIHVNDFLSLAQLEQAARNAGLDCESAVATEVRYYASLNDLARELKGIGAHNINSGRPKGLTGRQKFMRAASAFLEHSEPGKGVPVSYEICYLVLTRPFARGS